MSAAAIALYAFVFLKNAWVSDDAYILFRSLDQLLDGNGPRWNPHERVQVFTCPLWYGLLATLGWFSRDHYLHAILLSAACNLVVLWRLFQLLPTPLHRLLAVVLLTFSQAYFDFTSSGLENPLAYALLASIARYCLLDDLPPASRHQRLLFATGLLLITRHDLLWLVLPLVLHTLRVSPRRQTGFILLLLPLVAWTVFSLVYYGFPFPNTAYAKLAAVVPRATFLQHGMTYFHVSLLRDLPSISVLVIGTVLGLCHRGASRLLTAGILLHVIYIVWIGGDFMRGRFFSWDVLLSTILIWQTPLPTTPRWRGAVANGRCLLLLLAMTMCVWLPWRPPVLTPWVWGTPPFGAPDTAQGITQERNFYFRFTSLMRYWRKHDTLLLAHGWCVDSQEQLRRGIPVTLANTMGFRGYCLGTQATVIDWLGITDPLLARMPKNPQQQNWRPGHTQRLLPDGYCTSVLHHDNRFTDPQWRALYHELTLLTQSPDLFSRDRWRAIWQFNTGAHDDDWRAAEHALLTRANLPDGKHWQQQARHDCPTIELPPATLEQLKSVNPDTD